MFIMSSEMPCEQPTVMAVFSLLENLHCGRPNCTINFNYPNETVLAEIDKSTIQMQRVKNCWKHEMWT